MDFELEWLRPSLLTCQVSGLATVEGCEALMRAMRSDPRFHPGIGMVILETDLDAAALTAADIEQIAELRAEFPHVPPVRSALVTGSDSPVRYGLARMFEAYSEPGEDTSLAVFETLDEAMVWLGEGDALDSPMSTTGDAGSPPVRLGRIDER